MGGRHMEFHDVANMFPLMADDEYQALVEDIRAHGLREPIWTHEGKIIDGRNRYRACVELGIEPRFRAWHGQGSLGAFVVSLNLQRRHLSSSQKAVIALEVEQQLAKENPPGRPRKDETPQKVAGFSGEARERAAQLVGTNRQYVSDAKRLAKTAPDLLPSVRDGRITMKDAKRAATLPEQERTAVVEAIASGSAKDVGDAQRAARRAAAFDYRPHFAALLADNPRLAHYEAAVTRGELKVCLMGGPGQPADEHYPVLEVQTLSSPFTGQTWHWPKYSGAEITPIQPKGNTYAEDLHVPLFTPAEWDEFLAFDEAAVLEDLDFPGCTWFNWDPTAWRVPFRTFGVRDHWVGTATARRAYDLTYGRFLTTHEPSCELCKVTSAGGAIFVRQGWGVWETVEFNDGNGGRARRRYFQHDHGRRSLVEQAIHTVDPFAFSDFNFRRLAIWQAQPLEVSWSYCRRKTIPRETAIAALEADLARLRATEPLSEAELLDRALDWLQAYTPPPQAIEWREGTCTYPRRDDGTIDVERLRTLRGA